MWVFIVFTLNHEPSPLGYHIKGSMMSIKLHFFLLAVPLLLSACSATQNGQYEENAIIHTVTPEDVAATRSKAPIQAESVVLWVNGLGCPQCASNIDKQLLRMTGVKSVYVDLSNGKVTMDLRPQARPSPYRLSEAVADAGFTLVKIEAAPLDAAQTK